MHDVHSNLLVFGGFWLVEFFVWEFASTVGGIAGVGLLFLFCAFGFWHRLNCGFWYGGLSVWVACFRVLIGFEVLRDLILMKV